MVADSRVVAAAARVVDKGIAADRGIAAVGGVAHQRMMTDGDVEVTCRVARERFITDSRVGRAGGVAYERLDTNSRVPVACRVVGKGIGTDGRVVAGIIRQEGTSSDRGIRATGRVDREGSVAIGRYSDCLQYCCTARYHRWPYSAHLWY